MDFAKIITSHSICDLFWLNFSLYTVALRAVDDICKSYNFEKWKWEPSLKKDICKISGYRNSSDNNNNPKNLADQKILER